MNSPRRPRAGTVAPKVFGHGDPRWLRQPWWLLTAAGAFSLVLLHSQLGPSKMLVVKKGRKPDCCVVRPRAAGSTMACILALGLLAWANMLIVRLLRQRQAHRAWWLAL